MIRTVRFVGPLRHLCPKPVQIHGETAAEVIEGLSRQLAALRPDPETGAKVIRLIGFNTEADLHVPLGDRTEIVVCPPVRFGKDNGLTQILIGLTLIVVAVAMGGTFWPAVVTSLGVTLVSGGISAMLAPQPSLREGDEDQRSRYLGTPQNTVGPNTRIPLLYGKDLVQGHFLSFDIDAKEAV